MTTLNRAAYENLVDGDLEWLDAQPASVERSHIAAVLKRSADHEYAPDYAGALRECVEALENVSGCVCAECQRVSRAALARATKVLGAKGDGNG